ncbi:hypothetical protein HMPREF0658_0738 [Hoylesella marshii DSM 16973 = JCM 13450]|uniref:Uncharacterized protein n=1 Tax=Hoylesella marshii DSM 16973 = JCM 13450 TaxID=862515 RepID=E0NRD7_9BACT|nr:hypothetical protein HMPREF0658_0738 [Hoylesella marshii DSM 16973 = JCM 13450]
MKTIAFHEHNQFPQTIVLHKKDTILYIECSKIKIRRFRFAIQAFCRTFAVAREQDAETKQ